MLVVVGGGIALFIGSVLAWLNERTDARMGVLTDALPLIPFLMPVIAAAAGWVSLASPRAGMLNSFIRVVLDKIGITLETGPFDIFTWYGLIFVYVLYLVPYPYLFVSAGLRNLDPSLEEQSRVCGAGLWRTLWRVTIPNVWPNVAGAALIVATIGFAMIAAPIVIGTPAGIEVVSVRIVRLLGFSFPPQTAEAVGLSLFVLVALVILWRVQARLLKGGRFATVGGRSPPGPENRARQMEVAGAGASVRLRLYSSGSAGCGPDARHVERILDATHRLGQPRPRRVSHGPVREQDHARCPLQQHLARCGWGDHWHHHFGRDLGLRTANQEPV